MFYVNIQQGIFIARPNRFLAIVEVDGRQEVCHVKNTGRCRELFLPGATVFIQKTDNPLRKTKFDLIAVRKGARLINVDSQAPNKVTAEYLPKFFPNIRFIRPEAFYKSSRFDFYIETEQEKIFMEVKGVTLEQDNVAFFPDAPTERGVKHLKELCDCMQEGYQAYVLFVLQMADICAFSPNDATHPQFGKTLRIADKAGVKILAKSCLVTPNTLEITNSVPVIL